MTSEGDEFTPADGSPGSSGEIQGVMEFELPPGRALVNVRPVPLYRLHDTTGDDLGTIEHPARRTSSRVT